MSCSEPKPAWLEHRGVWAVKGGAQDCPYTYMKDMVNGDYRLPWEDEVVFTDGTSCGFEAPLREYAGEELPNTVTPIKQ